MTPDKQAAPSEWVEQTLALADSFRLADELAGDEDQAGESDADRTWSALRAHLESREALVKQLAALLERYVACDVSMDNMNRNDAPCNLKGSNLHRESVAALAAYQEKT
jgi:hypothetical protein